MKEHLCRFRDVFWAASVWLVWATSYLLWPAVHANTTVGVRRKPVARLIAGTFWRVFKHNVRTFFYRPPRSARQNRRPQGKEIGIRHFGLRALYLAGERADPYGDLGQEKLGKPVYGPFWQTDGYTIGRATQRARALPVKSDPHGADARLWDVQNLNEQANKQPAGRGLIAIQSAPAPRHACHPVECRGPVRKKATSPRIRTPRVYYENRRCGEKIDEDGYL